MGNWKPEAESINVTSAHDAKFNFGSFIQTGDRIVLGDGSEGVFELDDIEGLVSIASGPAGAGAASAMEGP